MAVYAVASPRRSPGKAQRGRCMLGLDSEGTRSFQSPEASSPNISALALEGTKGLIISETHEQTCDQQNENRGCVFKELPNARKSRFRL